MNQEIEFLINRLQKESERTLAFFSALGGEAWQRRLYSDGAQWNVHQIFAHLVASEKGFFQLLENILSGKGGVPQGFDLNEYNERKVDELAGTSPQELMTLFEERRKQVIDLVKKMRAEDLEKVGRHPFIGVASVKQILKLLYRHDQMHQNDISQALEAGG